uniref:uncharacterized protein LOC122602438 n=1 Tax=Erigeron canadensis TaxID=72917 RepID=UPI001CB977F8|nr:uncharacterized protein LOC122602438 [Erigeron canadensis]XP_043631055.1 uncharacterized protein LOC122602438 [Erigeron canadensis]
MKRKRTYRPPAKTTLRNPSAVVAEPETSRRFVSDGRTDENVTSQHMETGHLSTGTGIRGKQADLETENNVNANTESYPDVLGKMIATIIREISKDSGGIGNLSRSLVANSVTNGQMGQSHVNQTRLHQNPELNASLEVYGQMGQSDVNQTRGHQTPELNAALEVIKKTMKLDAAAPFNQPVDPVALGIPDYFDVIKTPMDFGTICYNLENGLKYMNETEVFQDVQCIWNNCLIYNKNGNHILELMKRVQTLFTKYWKAAGLDNKQSAAVAESSNLRHNKQQICNPRPPLINMATLLPRNNAGSNQVAENAAVPISLQPGEPHQSSSIPQTSSESEQPEPDIGAPDATFIPRKYQIQGNTRCDKLLMTVGRIKVVTNELGQPVGPEASKLTWFLGRTARDGNLAPLIYPTWREVPEENKENMWQKVLSKFDIDSDCRSWVLTSLKNKWKNFKCTLKATRYDTHKTDRERLADRDVRVLPDQWSFLVAKWSSEKWQSISARAKASRAKVKFNHTSGTKSFARLLEEERAKRPDGKGPSGAELFILTRTHKNGQPVNEASAAVISQLCESGTQGDVPLPGSNGAPSLRGIAIPTRADALRMFKEKNAEVAEMRERLASVEQTCSQMAAQMSTMVSMMASMQKNFPAGSFPNAGACTSVPMGMPNQSEPASTSSHEVPLKKTRGRKKRR